MPHRRPGRLVAFPVLVFAIWRIAHALVVQVTGGDLVRATTSFDAAYYVDILRDGYTVPSEGYGTYSDVAFFPGLAWLTAVVQSVVRDETAAVLVTANALALAAFVGVHLATEAWTGDQGMARRVTVGLALLPTSYFLWCFYAEALLIATIALAAWAARTQRSLLVLPLLVVAATARVVGVGVGPVLAIARGIEQRRVDATAVGYVLASAAGFAAVLLTHSGQSGDAFAWTAAQEAWGREAAPPWVPVYDAVRRVVDVQPDIAFGTALNLATVLLVGGLVVLLALGWRAGRWPVAPVGLAAAFWLAPLFSRLISSQVRFALICWPVLLVPARWWPRLPRWLQGAVVAAALLGTVVLLDRLSAGVFIA